jgi:phage shock protein PspC (stress-responsive transcriptional regulator)
MVAARIVAHDRSMDAPTEPLAPQPPPAQPPPGPPLPATSPPATSPPPRRLVRRLDERLLGGVAGGVADALGIDVVVVRLGFVVSAFFGGLGVIAYGLGWLLLPGAPATSPATSPRGDRRQLLGYGLVALGLLAVGGRLGWSFRGSGIFWPLVLIGLGAAVLWLRTRDDGDVPPPPPGAGPSDDGPTRPGPAVGTALDVTEAGTTTMPAPIPMRAPVEPATSGEPPAGTQRSYLGAVTVSALLVLGGTAWILDASGAWDVDLGVLTAIALAIVGAALVVSTWYGRARGLLALGIPLVLLVGLFGVVDVPLRGGIGDPTHHPRTVGAIDPDYELAIGNLSVDLRDVDFAGARRHVRAQVGIGQLNVTVPTGVRVVLDAHPGAGHPAPRVPLSPPPPHAGAGGVTAFGRSAHECCPTDVHRTSPGGPGGGTLYLDANVGAGHVDVIRRGESLRASS